MRCHDVYIEDNEEWSEHPGNLRDDDKVAVTDGLCPDCVKEVLRTASTRLAAPIMDLYHGTRDPDLRAEDLEPQMPPYRGSIGEGVYFGERPETAQFYSGDRGRVLHRRVDVRNPLIIDAEQGINYRTPPEFEGTYDEDEGWIPNPDAPDSVLVGESMPPFDALIGGQWCEIRDWYDLQNIAHWASGAGHDAVIMRGVRQNGSGADNEVLILPHHPDLRHAMSRSAEAPLQLSRLGPFYTRENSGWISPGGLTRSKSEDVVPRKGRFGDGDPIIRSIRVR